MRTKLIVFRCPYHPRGIDAQCLYDCSIDTIVCYIVEPRHFMAHPLAHSMAFYSALWWRVNFVMLAITRQIDLLTDLSPRSVPTPTPEGLAAFLPSPSSLPLLSVRLPTLQLHYYYCQPKYRFCGRLYVLIDNGEHMDGNQNTIYVDLRKRDITPKWDHSKL